MACWLGGSELHWNEGRDCAKFLDLRFMTTIIPVTYFFKFFLVVLFFVNLFHCVNKQGVKRELYWYLRFGGIAVSLCVRILFFIAVNERGGLASTRYPDN